MWEEKKKKIILSEKQIESCILRWLNAQWDCFAFKVNTVGIYDPVKKVFRKNMNPYILKGTSDIIGVCRGRFFAIEVKTPLTIRTGLSEEQIQFLERVKTRKGYGFAVCNLDQVSFLIEKIRSENPS